MIRNLKALGLALVAMLALGAVVASAASAQVPGDVTSDGPVTLTGTETGEETNFLSAFGGTKVRCPGSTYTGHEVEVTPHEFLPEHFGVATITPNYVNCVTAGIFRTTVDMNGCDYEMEVGETTGTDEYEVIADLVCPAGKDVTVTIFWNEHDHLTTNTPFCVMHIKPQVGLKGAELKDTTNGHLDLTGTAKKIHVVSTDEGHHPLFCPGAPGEPKTDAEAELALDVTVAGHNEEGGTTALSISENA